MFGQEVHGLSSAGKPLSGWLARDCIQECREACGGHGYLRCKQHMLVNMYHGSSVGDIWGLEMNHCTAHWSRAKLCTSTCLSDCMNIDAPIFFFNLYECGSPFMGCKCRSDTNYKCKHSNLLINLAYMLPWGQNLFHTWRAPCISYLTHRRWMLGMVTTQNSCQNSNMAYLNLILLLLVVRSLVAMITLQVSLDSRSSDILGNLVICWALFSESYLVGGKTPVDMHCAWAVVHKSQHL